MILSPDPSNQPGIPASAPAATPSSPSKLRALFPVRTWEAWAVFFVTFLVLAIFTPRITTYLDPTTGDEPFYLMTAISILKDGDLNECNNYIQHDEITLYPPFYGFSADGRGFVSFPPGWKGWPSSPLPLPPHPALISPASRQCSSNYSQYPVVYDNPTGELYSKHGLGLSLLVLPSFALGGRLFVVFFLNIIGAILAANVYLLARESVKKLAPAILTWVAFAFTVPQMPYSYLIFTELPAALLTLYAFRRIRIWKNNPVQIAAIGFCVAFLPWLHYRFAPICLGLAIYYIYQIRQHRDLPRPMQIRNWALVGTPVVVSGLLLMYFFQSRYGIPIPNGSDHAGISDVAGTLRGAVGLFLDQQWGLLVASPIFILAFVGLILMWILRGWRSDLLWIGVVIVPYFLVIANYAQWWGEWCPPGRYMTSILPLLALPFALALDNIKSIIYKVIYGVLLALSFLTMIGFLYQPQWMYNQPIVGGQLNGKSELLVHGFSILALQFNMPSLTKIDLTNFFPKFVSPYFAYNYQGQALGDAASDAAWRASLWPLAIIIFIVFVSLFLAWQTQRRKEPPQPYDSTDGPSSGESLPPEAIEGLPGVPTRPARSLPGRTARSLPQSEGSAFSFLRIRLRWFHLLLTIRGVFSPAIERVRSLYKRLSIEDEPFVTAEVSANSVDVAEKHTIRHRIAANPFWRTRGLWFGLAAVGIAMYAQRVTTVDKDIVSSIHWYILAIFLMLVGWLGTYKDRTFLVRPVERKKLNKKRSSQDIASDEPGSLQSEATAAHSPSEYSAPQITSLDEAIPPLSLHKEKSPPQVSLNGNGTGEFTAPYADNHIDPLVSAATLPVRIRLDSSASSSQSSLTTSASMSPPDQSGPSTNPLASQLDTLNSGPVTQPLATSPEDPAPAAPTPDATLSVRSVRSRSRVPLTLARRWLPASSSAWWRYWLVFCALVINIFSAQLIRANYYSALGSWGWLLSLAILLLAFLREPRREAKELDPTTDVMQETDTHLSRRVEVFVVIAIVLLALGIRLLNLGDWTTGVHGDEGEAGMDAIGILEGNHVSPFDTGWFQQPNFYYWALAITMKIFGTSLFGLRLFSTLVGALMVLPFYPLVKMWFGIRTAIIASLLLAFSDVAIHFSRAEFSNITTPTFLVTGFYFLFRGLRSKRTLDFIVSGYFFMLTMYFYLGGRITPFLVIGVLAYMLLISPILRIPGAYSVIRRLTPDMGRLHALGSAVTEQARSVSHYFSQVAVFVIACVCFASPWLVYYLDNSALLNTRTNDKLIFNNEARMASDYHVTHDPLYIGLRMPTSSDIFPFSPVVFEPAPISVQVSNDGFWPRVMWDQLTTTLSIFTYRIDASSVYTFTGEPVSKPIEAALLILGIAWALWRWRDARMAILSGWFWSSIIVGGVLTIDAPYMARLVGIIPTMAIFAALPLSKLAAELLRFGRIFSSYLRSLRLRRILLGTSRGFSASLLGVLLLYLGLQNYNDYFNRYMKSFPSAAATGVAEFVRQTNDALASEGRPSAKFLSAGAYFIFWDYGVNRFLNHGAVGSDMVNASDDLPILDNGDRDVVFILWDNNRQYLPILKAYYPEGIAEPYQYGPTTLFTSFTVKKETIDAHRLSLATYTPATGGASWRQETTLGTSSAPPDGLTYPVQAQWATGLFAPEYARYSFSLDLANDSQFLIDGTPVLTTTATDPHAEANLILARGLHNVELRGTLKDPSAQVQLQWQVSGQPSGAIPRQYLWNGKGEGLLGQVWQSSLALTGPSWDAIQPNLPPSLITRIDGFLGFQNSPGALINGSFTAIWKGDVTIPQSGDYTFESFSNGGSVILIDNKVVVNNESDGTDPHTGTGTVNLTGGNHSFELRYNYVGGTGYLEVYWTMPDGTREILGPSHLHTTGGIVDPANAIEPPADFESPNPVPLLAPDAVLGGSSTLGGPRGLAIGPDGNLYIGDRENHRIVVMSPDGKVLRTWGKPSQAGNPIAPDEFDDIADVATGPNGNVYVMDIGANRLQVFDPQGNLQNSIPGSQLGITTGNGITVDANGRIYIAQTAGSRLQVIAPLTAENDHPAVTTFTGGTGADSLEQPVDAVADPTGSGMVYVADLKNRIVELTPDGSVGRSWEVKVGTDTGGSRLAISRDGSVLYMSDPERQRFAVINLKTNEIDYFGQAGDNPGNFRSPQGIAVGADGRVYVLDRTLDNVQVFTIK